MKKPRLLLVPVALAVAALWVGLRISRPESSAGSRPDQLGLEGSAPRLSSIGPRVVSNQTSQPLAVYGEGLVVGTTLRLGPPISLELPLTVLDGEHAYALMPGGLELPADRAQVVVAVGLGRVPGDSASGGELRRKLAEDGQLALGAGAGEPSPTLTVVNDIAFVDLTALSTSGDGRTVFALSPTTDELRVISPATGAVQVFPTEDGPVAISAWTDGDQKEWSVVAHAFAPRLLLIDSAGLRRVLPAPSFATGLAVDQSAGVAFLAEHARDSVVAIELSSGKERWRTPVAPNPRSLALTSGGLAVGSLQTGEIELLDPVSGQPRSRFQPSARTAIIGGKTADYSQYAINGSAPRAFAWSTRLSRLFVSSIGPNIGPNPERVEVSMNGGVGVVELSRAPEGWLRHLGFGAGVTEGLALDDRAGLLYAADPALGLVRVVDANKLARSSQAAASALLQELAIPPPDRFPTVRPPKDFSVLNRAGLALHSGPRALALSADGATLYVLSRFTGTLAVVDVRKAREGRASLVRQIALADTLSQPTRRLGQVLFFADLGRTAMSCDACHLEGHTGGVLFEKTSPMRIYRSTSLRVSVESPPYFTPASTRSLAETSQVVGGRNRFHNPDPTSTEAEALTLFTATMTLPPNPFLGSDGAPTERLELPDGKVGNPRRGVALFEGKAQCSGCHPAPHFTSDQVASTRGRYLDVGTPRGLMLRPELQNLEFQGFAPPSLLGAWDVFPMFTTGSAGLAVGEGRVEVGTRFPLRVAVEKYGGPLHGRADLLTEQERDDLLAYVMSL